MPVGPELPPHLQKRKRSIDDDSTSTSPPTKIRAATPPKERRILGPAPPPADLSQRPINSPSAEKSSEDDSSDDDYGPSLPPVPGSAAFYEAEAKTKRDFQDNSAAAATNQSTKPQRADWMLVPPSDSDWTSRVDPTKMKARKFATGKGSKAPSEKNGISAIWTETPEQKRQRLEDEVLGRREKAVNSTSVGHADGHSKGNKASREDEATAQRIKEYNERKRGKTLLEEFESGAGGGQKEEDDDPSKRAFDKEKDMALGGQLGHAARKDLLKKAGDLGSRFSKGSYL